MPGGRPPKPIEQKRLAGNPGKRALPEPRVLALVPDQVPAIPKHLRREGKAAWRRYWSLGRAWLHPVSDYAIVLRLCESYDERALYRRKMAEYITQMGEDRAILVRSGTGGTAINPLIQAMRAIESQITRMEGLCGFTPSDRSRLGLAEVVRESKLDQLLERRAATGD